MTRPLALRKVIPPAPEPVAGETLVYAADQHAGLAHLISSQLSVGDDPDAYQAAALLADALERQAALLRLFMERPDDPAEVPGEGRADG